MNRNELQFFTLLRAGLWGNPADKGLFTSTTDWNRILTIAGMQTVIGVVFDGISTLPPDLQPPSDIFRKLYYNVVRIEKSHEILNHQLVEVVQRLQSEGIHPVLLKGQGMALNYPDPLHRQCGDIDLYVGRKNCDKAIQILLGLGAKHDNKTGKNPKHESFCIGNVDVELHFLVDKLNPVYDKKFQRWVNEQFNESKYIIWNLKGTDIQLPPADFNAFYIFHHFFHHFVKDGIGFRQICDWVLFLHTFHQQFNQQELHANLKAFGLLKPWQIFGCVVVDTLGLPKEEFPFYSEKYKKHTHKILQEILFGGNFGFYNPNRTKRPSNYIAGKLHSLKNRFRRFFKIFPLFPKQISDYSITYAYIGIIQIMKDILKIR